MGKVTYLIGTGASCGYLPAVKEIPARLTIFKEFLKTITDFGLSHSPFLPDRRLQVTQTLKGIGEEHYQVTARNKPSLLVSSRNYLDKDGEKCSGKYKISTLIKSNL